MIFISSSDYSIKHLKVNSLQEEIFLHNLKLFITLFFKNKGSFDVMY